MCGKMLKWTFGRSQNFAEGLTGYSAEAEAEYQ